jgi:hypothetical protein
MVSPICWFRDEVAANFQMIKVGRKTARFDYCLCNHKSTRKLNTWANSLGAPTFDLVQIELNQNGQSEQIAGRVPSTDCRSD